MRDLRRSGLSVITAFAALALAACHTESALAPDAESAGGVWESVSTEAGTSERWILDVHDGVVHGTGTWTGATCCGEGTLTLTGSARGDSLHLDLTYFVTFAGDSLFVFRSGDHVDAILDSQTDLVGTRVIIASSVDVLFHSIHFQKASR